MNLVISDELGLQDHSALLKQLKKNAVVKKVILKIILTIVLV